MFPFLSLHFSTFLFHPVFFFTAFTSSCALLNWYSIVLAFFSFSFFVSPVLHLLPQQMIYSPVHPGIKNSRLNAFNFFFELLLFAPALHLIRFFNRCCSAEAIDSTFCVSDSSVVNYAFSSFNFRICLALVILEE